MPMRQRFAGRAACAAASVAPIETRANNTADAGRPFGRTMGIGTRRSASAIGLIHAGAPPRTANSSVTRQPQVRVRGPAAAAAARTASASPPSAATSAARIAIRPWPSATVPES
jgi:hypothetical protein